MRFVRFVSAPALLACTLLVTGCADYLARRESLSPHAGRAQQINALIHAGPGIPEHAHDRDLEFDGQRMGTRVNQYRNPPPAASSSPAPSAPAGADLPATGGVVAP